MADWEICCDDSFKDGSRYMIYAGVMLPRDLAVSLSDGIGKWRQGEGLTEEIKWTRTTELNVERFKTFAGGTMRYINMGSASFACTVFDRHDRRHYRGDTPTERWANMAFDFLLNCFALRAEQHDGMWIFPDDGMFRCNQEELRDRLNAAIAFRKGWARLAIRPGNQNATIRRLSVRTDGRPICGCRGEAITAITILHRVGCC